MRIAQISGEASFKQDVQMTKKGIQRGPGVANYEVFVRYFKVKSEDDETFQLSRSDEGPRSNFLYKKFNQEGAYDGYESIDSPGWIDAKPYQVTGQIYVRELELEKGKELLKEALIKAIEENVSKFEQLKNQISGGQKK
jgi:hypothetical protein